MKLFIGLGNPGVKYQGNRHNAGHMFIDWLRSHDSRLTTLKTDTFMNQSGEYVKKHTKKETLEKLYIVHDDLDIPLGKFKIQFGTGPKLHNGIRSIEESLGTEDFWRVRIGVDARPSNSGDSYRIDGETYSLQDFTPEEQQQLQTVFETIYKQLTQ